MGRFDRIAIAAMVLALSAPVLAQPTKVEEAKAAELKKQGDDLVHAAKFKEALEKYDESFAIIPNPAIQYNRGNAFKSLEDWNAALDAFEKFEATAPPELKSKVPNLDKTMAEVKEHVATLVVKCNVPGATILVGEKNVGTAPFRTTPGDMTITASAPGYITVKQDVTLMPGETATIDVPLKKAASEPIASTKEPTPFDGQAQPPPDTKDNPPSHGSGWKTLAWVSGGIGIATLGAGVAFFGLSIADKNSADANHCFNKVCDAAGQKTINEAWTFADVSTVLVITGAVALALSLTSFIVAPRRKDAASPKGVEARVFIGPGAAGIGGTF
ncbi:MAG TPA: PEGA domain-containing protein [Polyangiaceae bacterium]|jgi:hypothetical protein